MIILIIVIYVGIALMLLPKLLKERKIKELIITGALLLTGFLLTIRYSQNAAIPSPANALKALLDMAELHY